MMKRSLCLAFALALLLTACGKTPPSSASVSSASSAPAASASAPVNDAAPPEDSSASSASSAPAVELEQKCFVSLPVQGGEKPGLLVLQVPADWEYDNRVTFSLDGKKVAEAKALWTAGSGGAPFTAEMTAAYENHDGYFPEGYGLMGTVDGAVNGNKTRTYCYKTWPDDANEPWYPRYTFLALDGYVVELDFYTASETPDTALYDAILASAELHFAED